MKELKVLTNYESENLKVDELLWDISKYLTDVNLVKASEELSDRIDDEELDTEESIEAFDEMLANLGYKSLTEMFKKNIDIEDMCNIVLAKGRRVLNVYVSNNYKDALLEYIDEDDNIGIREEIDDRILNDFEKEIGRELDEEERYDFFEENNSFDWLDELDCSEVEQIATRDFGQTKEEFKVELFDNVLCHFDYDDNGNILSIEIEDIINYYC